MAIKVIPAKSKSTTATPTPADQKPLAEITLTCFFAIALTVSQAKLAKKMSMNVKASLA